jgi:DNA mismatch repair protein MutL
MNRIKILDDAVAGRIAAGEVVTGPVAAVKELTENAIDARAGAVTVEIKDGGRTYIRVTDNGSGIHPDDVLLSVQKHATSKISGFEDMKSIASLGFRGEALSSIAAVSRLTIKTRLAGEMEGSILEEGPAGFRVKPAGLPDGTTVTVENLFYNVPARYKFLKSAQAESAAITDLLTRLVLSRPDISFKYITNGALQLMSPGTGDLMDAVLAVYGREIKTRLYPIRGAAGELSVFGFLSNPNYLFKSPKNQTILINKRYVHSKSITDALSRAYGDRILKAHYPFAVLDIRLPFSSVDVNVHPSKTTVMIKEESELLSLLDSAVRDALAGTSLPRFEITENKTDKNEELRQQKIVPPVRQAFSSPKPKFEFREQAVPAQFDTFAGRAWPSDEPEEKEEEQQRIAGMDELYDYRVLGQLFETYILVQSGDALYIIDQHAAHERINYEKLKKEETLLPQRLLFPYALKLSMADHDLLLQNAPRLSQLGFELEDFGGSTIKIASLPLKSDQSDIGELMEDVLEILKDTGAGDPTVLRDKIIRHACRISVKAGDRLSDPEMKELVLELVTSKTIPVCPHGRPVAIVLKRDELEKGFKRKV